MVPSVPQRYRDGLGQLEKIVAQRPSEGLC